MGVIESDLAEKDSSNLWASMIPSTYQKLICDRAELEISEPNLEEYSFNFRATISLKDIGQSCGGVLGSREYGLARLLGFLHLLVS
jgi:hypothetical protein